MKVPRFGRNLVVLPTGDSTEPNHAVIYNVRENIWYDTELPTVGARRGPVSGSLPQAAHVVACWPLPAERQRGIARGRRHRVAESGRDPRSREESGSHGSTACGSNEVVHAMRWMALYINPILSHG
jgi:hypothetical protein